MPTDDNTDCADLDKSNAQVMNGRFLSTMQRSQGVCRTFYRCCCKRRSIACKS